MKIVNNIELEKKAHVNTVINYIVSYFFEILYYISLKSTRTNEGELKKRDCYRKISTSIEVFRILHPKLLTLWLHNSNPND
jgi:hypothetical protein